MEEVRGKDVDSVVVLGFNRAFVGLNNSRRLNVEPKVLAIDLGQWNKVKYPLYITNISNVRQYFKLRSSHFQNFRMRVFEHVDPGQTLVQVIVVKNPDFGSRPVNLSLYFAAHKHEKLHEHHEGKITIPVRLSGRSNSRTQPETTQQNEWLLDATQLPEDPPTTEKDDIKDL